MIGNERNCDHVKLGVTWVTLPRTLRSGYYPFVCSEKPSRCFCVSEACTTDTIDPAKLQGGGQKIRLLREALKPYQKETDTLILFVDA